MNRKHAITISLAAALAAIAGTVAAPRAFTSATPRRRRRRARPPSSPSEAPALDRMEVSLRKALAQKPPKLPALPHTVSGGGAPVGAAPAQQTAQRVIYVRPAPHIVTIHRAGGGHENEHEGDRGDEHGGGGGFDD